MGITIKAAFLLLYFSFLRQSNISPKSTKKFDPTRHLAIADIFFSPPGYIILVKWTKTLQYGRHVLLPVPKIPHRHCPVQAMRSMLALKPKGTTRDSPLFTLPNSDTPMTTTYLNDAFQIIMKALGMPDNAYSLHSYRRGGATEAYTAGVNYAQVKSHGIWSSDSFWSYISTSTLSTTVPDALAASFVKH
jgi:integrase